MVGAERLLRDRQVALEERLGLAVAALPLVERGEVVQARGNELMVGAEGLLPDRQGALHERLGLGVAAARSSISDQIAASAPTRWSMSESLCSGDGVMRSRSVPRDTVG